MVATSQLAVADVLVAAGKEDTDTARKRAAWAETASGLLSRISANDAETEEMKQRLSSFLETERTTLSVEELEAPALELEGVLLRQQMLLEFHFADPRNAYREAVDGLSGQLVGAQRAEDRLDISRRLVELSDRYKAVYLRRLLELRDAAPRLLDRCLRLTALVTKGGDLPHRWAFLTAELIQARQGAIEGVQRKLEVDRFLASGYLEGTIKENIEGEPLDRFLGLATGLADHVRACVDAEDRIKNERDSLVRKLVPAGEEAQSEVSAAAEKQVRPTERHPLESKMWFRLAKVAWILSGIVMLGLLAAVADTSVGLLSGIAVIVLLLWGVRALAYYVMLSRATLYEKPGSGFVDLEALKGVMEDSGAGAEAIKQIEILKERFGRRAPAAVVKAAHDRYVGGLRKAKEEILTESDKQGLTISLRDVLEKTLKDLERYSGYRKELAAAAAERVAMELEVRYGPELPASVADRIGSSDSRSL